MIDKAHLQGKTVGLRLTCLPTAVDATVSYVERDGLWLVGQNLMTQLAQKGGGLPVGGMKTPAVYVPFADIVWIVAENA